MATLWAQEACDRYLDPESGSRVIQLTSSSAMSNNVYCEQPYTSPDGKRVAILRMQDPFDVVRMLLVADLDTLRITLAERQLISSVGTSAWSGLLYFWTSDRCLKRLSLRTLETETILREEDPKVQLGAWSVSPDSRYLIYGLWLPELTAVVVRLDLRTGERKIILEDPEVINPHPKFEPIHGSFSKTRR
jgi:hypothetical protein